MSLLNHHQHHRRSSFSRHSRSPESPRRPKSPPLPTQTYHPSILPQAIPAPALLESVAGGAHYTGVKIEPHDTLQRRRSSGGPQSLTNSPELAKSQLKRHDHQRILDDLEELYCARPTPDIFARSWRPDAEFEDPLCRCKGLQECAAQWYALPKFFSSSKQISRRVMSSTETPNRLIVHQVQEYTTRLFNKVKTIESIIVVDLDEDDKVARLVDQWNGESLPTRWGASFLRMLNAKITSWVVHVPKDQT